MSKNTQMNYDLTITIQGIKVKETFTLTLKHNVKDRYEELTTKLEPFHMHFQDDTMLFDMDYICADIGDTTVSNEPVAELISDSDELSCWLQNDASLLSI